MPRNDTTTAAIQSALMTMRARARLVVMTARQVPSTHGALDLAALLAV
jgi:hypothetical protein